MRSVAITAGLTPELAIGPALGAARDAGRPDPRRSNQARTAGRGGDARRDVGGALRHLRHRGARGVPGACGAVREPRQRADRDGDGAARPCLRRLRAGADRGQPERLQPDRARPPGRDHGEERHPDRRVRRPVARPRPLGARRHRGGDAHPPAPGDDDDDRDGARRRAADPSRAAPVRRRAMRSAGSSSAASARRRWRRSI